MQYYTLNNQCHIFTPTGYFLLENVDDFDKAVATRSIPSWLPHELATEFKEASPIIKRNIKEKKEELARLVDVENKIKVWCYKNCSPKKREAVEDAYILFYVEAPRLNRNNEIEKLERILSYMKKGKGGELDVQKARQRPISDFIEFNSFGFARSIWNTSDKTPSMKYYPKENRVHCFSTGEDEDVIGVVMQLRNCKFIDAVKFILQ